MPEYRLVEHRGKWTLAYTEPGKGRQRISTGIPYRKDERGRAEAVASEIWKARTKPASERVADLWPIYAADRKTVAAAPKRFDHMWKALEPFFAYKMGKAITRSDCLDYTRARRTAGRTNSTIRSELEALRACLRWHYGKDAPKITAPPPSKPRDRRLTKEERDKLLAAIETPHVRLFVIIALTTGARAGAILDLTWDRVDFDIGTIDFNPAGRDKTNKRRTVVPINPRLREELEKVKAGALSDHVIEYGGNPVKSVKTAIYAASRRSGVKCSPHVFRHTAAVWMAQAKVPIEKIAQYLGHTSMKLTYSTYARFNPDYMQDGAEALNW